jgi:nitrogen PTS system EIIA component
MDFANLPIADSITDLNLGDKKRVLYDLAHRAAHAIKIDGDTVFQALMKREELGSTGVGEGVAIPHARIRLKEPYGIIARLKHPIEFNAIDGEPVDLVCLLLLPEANKPGQLDAMACVARRLRDPDVRREMRSAPNRVMLYNVLTGRTIKTKGKAAHIFF